MEERGVRSQPSVYGGLLTGGGSNCHTQETEGSIRT